MINLRKFSLIGVSLLSLSVASAEVHLPMAIGKLSLQAKQKIAGIRSANLIAGQYIVRFQPNTDEQEIARIKAEIKQNGGKVRQLSVINGVVGQIDSATVNRLVSDSNVKAIEANTSYSLDVSGATDNADSWGLDRLDQQNLPLDSTYAPYGDGSGVHVYVIGSGIRSTHLDFEGRASWDFTASDVTGSEDDYGHGTHMAGTVGGANYGVATQVSLHGVKVVDSTGSGSVAGMIEGLNYVANNHISPAIAVVANSVGYSQALNDAVAGAIAQGVVVISPSGDNNANACNYSPASVSNQLADAITVAATNSADEASGSANTGSCVDIFAPGIYIKSDWHSSDLHNNTISHSPMAAAHVAGAAALILANDPTCSVAQVKQTLIEQSRKNVLSNVINFTPNRLLAVPTQAPTGPTCAEQLEAPITDDGSQTDFDNDPDVDNVDGDLVDDLPQGEWLNDVMAGHMNCYSPNGFIVENGGWTVREGGVTLTPQIGVKKIGFAVGGPVTVEITTASGKVKVIEKPAGFVGIASDEDIIRVGIYSPVPVRISNFYRGRLNRDDKVYYGSKTEFDKLGVLYGFNSIERATRFGGWSPRIEGNGLICYSPSNVGLAGPGNTQFSVASTDTNIVTSDGDQDFTIEFTFPPNRLSFNTYLNEYGPATLTVTDVEGVETDYVINHDHNEVGFFGIDGNKQIQSIRWVSPNGRLVKTGVANLRMDVVLPELQSCKVILQNGLSTGDGVYTIDPDDDGPLPSFEAYCDMTTDGGGWTGITPELAYDFNGGSIYLRSGKTNYRSFSNKRPFTAANKRKSYLVYYDIPLNFYYSEFFLKDYQIRGAGEYVGGTNPFDIGPSGIMSTWNSGTNSNGIGDLGLGSPLDTGPALKFAAIRSWRVYQRTVYDTNINDVYSVSRGSNQFRIAWSQYSPDNGEGLFPWWGGTIFVR